LSLDNDQKVSRAETLEADILNCTRIEQKNLEFLFMPCFKTMVKIPVEIVDQVFEKCCEIQEKKDETFIFKIIRSTKRDITIDQRCKLLVIYSPDKERAYKRGAWMIYLFNLDKNVNIHAPCYWVKRFPSNLHYTEKETGRIVIHEEDNELLKGILKGKISVRIKRVEGTMINDSSELGF